jgi:hypothetical protein
VTQAATAWGAGGPSPAKFSCYRAESRRIKDGSVKPLLPARDDFLPLARVGSRRIASSVLAFVSREKHVPVNKAKAAGLTTADFPQFAASESDHGRQR